MSSSSDALEKQRRSVDRDIDIAYGGGRPHQTTQAWRSDLCFPCVALYCLPCAIADVMTRMGLGIFGRQTPSWCASAWNILVAFCVVYGLLYIITAILVPQACLDIQDIGLHTEPTADCDQADIHILVAVQWLTAIAYWLVFGAIVMTRYHLRKRDNIPTEYCPTACPYCCEDVLCGCCCSCLTVLQMHRHLEDHRYCRELQHQQQTRGGRTNDDNDFTMTTAEGVPLTAMDDEETGKAPPPHVDTKAL